MREYLTRYIPKTRKARTILEAKALENVAGRNRKGSEGTNVQGNKESASKKSKDSKIVKKEEKSPEKANQAKGKCKMKDKNTPSQPFEQQAKE